MASHRADAGARAPNVAAQHQETDDLTDGLHPVAMLSESHRPAHDDLACTHYLAVHRFDLLTRQTSGCEHVLPCDHARVQREPVKSDGVIVDEVVVQHRAGIVLLSLEHQPVKHLKKRQITARPNLDEYVGTDGALPQGTTYPLRVLKAHQTGFGKRVDRNHPTTVALGLLKCREHPGVVGPGVLSHYEYEIRFIDIVQRDATFARSKSLPQPRATRLVAHVRTVRQVVGPVGSHEQLKQERRLIVETPRRIEHGFIRRGEPIEFIRNDAERLCPLNRLIVSCTTAFDHRLGQPALFVQPHVRHAIEFGDGVPREELSRHSARGCIVCDVLRAVLTVLISMPLLRVWPSATRAVNSADLVEIEKRQGRSAQAALPHRVVDGVHNRRHARRPCFRR